jgi:hypothetical protein
MPASKQQEDLVACLARRNAKLARIYKGGLIVLLDENNPSRFELVAHSMRELIEKISLLTTGEDWAHGDGMSQLVPVRRAYEALTQGQGFNERFSLENSKEQVVTLILKLSGYFEWEAVNRPQLRKRIAQTLSALSGPGQALPVDVSENEVERWIRAYKYFNMVAHNRYDTVDRDDFVSNMTFIEKVLLSRLQPPAVPELDALDVLIQEGEDGH